MADGELHITVAAMPDPADSSDVSLERELGMVKSSLLYADRVTLYSIRLQMVFVALIHALTMSPDEVEKHLEPWLDSNNTDTAAKWAATVQAAVDSSDDAQKTPQEESIRDYSNVDVRAYFDSVFGPASLGDLVRPISEGILEVPSISSRFTKEMGTQYPLAVIDAMVSGTTYPMLDDHTSQYLLVGTSDDRTLTLTNTQRQRHQHISTASWLFHELPLFQTATMDEILDLQKELKNERILLRTAVADMADQIGDVPVEEFEGAARHVYTTRTRPELLKIDAAIKDNSTLRHFVEKAPIPAIVGTAIGMAAGGTTDLLHAVTSAIAGSAVGFAEAAVAAIIAKQNTDKEIRKNGLYFFYRAQERWSG